MAYICKHTLKLEEGHAKPGVPGRPIKLWGLSLEYDGKGMYAFCHWSKVYMPVSYNLK